MLEKNNKIDVIDVRTAGEFDQGHVKGPINIDMHQSDAMDKINKRDKMQLTLFIAGQRLGAGWLSTL